MSTEIANLNILGEKFAQRVLANQNKLRSELKTYYDFIVCGSGSSGSVVAGRLAQNPDLNVLLLEAGGHDEAPSVTEAHQWIKNIGTERYWQFQAEPNRWLNGRAISLGMGKGLGGGSSINAMIWARGHKSDWDFFASEAEDPAWSYESILNIYRRIEDWHGAPDPKYRGTGGPVFIQPKPDSSPVARALFEGMRSVGIPIFENQNGRMMEADGGASVPDLRIRDGKRQSVFRSYVFPHMDRPNLTVLPHALVTRLTFEGTRATGVEIFWSARTHRIRAGREVIMSLGAINTPKVLMQSGIGDESELQRFGIPVVQHLPGVGRGFQDHPVVACVWEGSEPLPPDVAPDAVLFWKSDSRLASPDFQILQGVLSAEDAAKLGLPMSGWTLLGNVVQPKSRGHIRLTGPDPHDPIQIEANLLCEPDDRKSLLECAKLCRELGNLEVLCPFLKQEVLPGKLKQTTLEDFIRNGALSFWHETSTACMGRDAMSVVDGNLKVYGVENLRIADGSIMPRVTTGNTMAPCVIIGERAAEIIRSQHEIEPLSFPIHGRNRTRHDTRRESMVSTQNKQMAQFFAFVTERMSRPDLDLATIRDVYERLHLAANEPEGVCYAEVDIDGVPALWCVPTDCDVTRVLLHAHGGGTVIFSMHVDRKAVGHIAKAAGARALVLDYRRSPEHKFPAQIQDMEKAYHWLLAKGIRAENIAVTGQSIGANLAVSLAIELRSKGVAMPGAILSVSGWYDMELKNDTIKSNAKNDKLLSRSILERFREAWLADTGTAWNDPRVNLLYADLAGLPPIQLYYGDHELFVGEITEFAKRAKDAGVDISVHSVPEGQHNFILGAGRVPEVNKAIEQMGQWLRSRLGSVNGEAA